MFAFPLLNLLFRIPPRTSAAILLILNAAFGVALLVFFHAWSLHIGDRYYSSVFEYLFEVSILASSVCSFAAGLGILLGMRQRWILLLTAIAFVLSGPILLHVTCMSFFLVVALIMIFLAGIDLVAHESKRGSGRYIGPPEDDEDWIV